MAGILLVDPSELSSDVTPDPVLIASEGALWGAIRHQGLLPDTVIVSDDAGQFRVGIHALCWVHAERLVHKLVPANDKQRNAIEVAKRMIWWAASHKFRAAPRPPLRIHENSPLQSGIHTRRANAPNFQLTQFFATRSRGERITTKDFTGPQRSRRNP